MVVESIEPMRVDIPENAFIPQAEFTPFPKISRLFRPVVITEKIDGTNAAVVVSPVSPYNHDDEEVVGPGIIINTNDHKMDGFQPLYVYAQSRKQVISPDKDNFGFATWVREHARELAVGLGEGVHFGEWWGSGIQRKYGLDEKRFSLFNVKKWGGNDYNDDGTRRPECCHIVPVLLELEKFNSHDVRVALDDLAVLGSSAAPGFMDPEGIVTYHAASNRLFKTTIKDDEKGKDHNA
jgi:RNA ligase